MVEGLYAGYQGFTALMSLAQQALKIRDAAGIQPIIVEFTSKLMDAQQHHALLVKRITDLEQQLMKFENWETEKQRYELVKLEPGIFLRRVKVGMENGEPAHEICANCYDNGKKSLLHNLGHVNGLTHWKCHSCGFDERSGAFNAPKINRRRGWQS